MDHGYFKDRLSAYIDQELTPEEIRAVSDHLEGCAECREQLTRLNELERLVAEHSGLDGDDYFKKAAQKIEQRLGEVYTTVTDISGTSGQKFRGLWWKITSVAASAAILVFIGLHQDEIFGPDDLVLPTDTPGELQPLVFPGDGDMADSFSNLGVNEEVSLPVEDQEVSRLSKEAEDSEVLEMEVAEDKRKDAPTIAMPVPDQIPELHEEAEVQMEEMRPPPSPPSPPKRTRRGAATSAVKDQTASKAVSDENYKLKQGVAADDELPSKSAMIEGVIDESTTIEVTEEDYVLSRDLSFWVQRRDSLLSLAVSVSPVERAKRIFSTSGTNSLAPAPSTPVSGQSADKVESDLLETWYWISKLSEDSAETVAAMAELERIAADSNSTNHDLAADYLRRLGD